MSIMNALDIRSEFRSFESSNEALHSSSGYTYASLVNVSCDIRSSLAPSGSSLKFLMPSVFSAVGKPCCAYTESDH